MSVTVRFTWVQLWYGSAASLIFKTNSYELQEQPWKLLVCSQNRATRARGLLFRPPGPAPGLSRASAVFLQLVPRVMSGTNIWGLSVVACWPSWATWFCHELRKYSKGGTVKLLLGSLGCQD